MFTKPKQLTEFSICHCFISFRGGKWLASKAWGFLYEYITQNRLFLLLNAQIISFTVHAGTMAEVRKDASTSPMTAGSQKELIIATTASLQHDTPR